jgi:putative ABC transport system permease protein
LAARVALTLQTSGVIKSNNAAVLAWVDQTVPSDLFVSSGGPLSAGGTNLSMREDVLDDLKREYPGTRTVAVSMRYLNWERGANKEVVLLVVLDFANYYAANRERHPDMPDLDLFRRLSEEPGTAAVSENFAVLHGVHVGDTLNLPSVEGTEPVRVIGTIVDYTWNRGTILVPRTPRNLYAFNARLPDLFHVYLPPGVDPGAARDRIQKSPWGAENALFAMTHTELRDHIEGLVKRLYGIAYTQEVVVAFVAALGVLTALLISVLQRRRELGLLRAVGATRFQVLRSVLAEAVLMGVLGTVIGVLVGAPLEWYIIRVILFEEAGFLLPVAFPWLAAGVIGGLAMAVAAAAGLGPALHAVRLRIADAIAYE